PINAPVLSDLGVFYHEAGRQREAVARTRQAVALEPFNWYFYHQLGRALKGENDLQGAADAESRACELGRSQQPCAALAIGLLQLGRDAEARAQAARAKAMPDSLAGTYNLACFWALAGDRDQALQFLRSSYGIGPGAAWIASDPDLASLHGDPEFEALIEEMKRRFENLGKSGS
ncbi:MAG: hypothetical protein O6947_01155, partial [Acidobacteria bacterium]|nr:hypothetical protein [Acidobacteriota bacterium]